ncbi:hypothetical protein KY306_02030 [Candidatus Woesearchaeota archaeon]|nr:hypothetical protein [Candidatus Woesearchaeota archaeon]
MKYIIEHMEETLSEWCYIEYQNISKIVGKNNLIFTNTNNHKLKKLGTIKTQHVYDLNLKNACLLDPSAKQTLTPADTKKFKYLIFGGILGDYPRKKRTKPLAKKLNIPARNIGKKQMSTDNAVLTCFMITNNTPLKKIKFKDKISIEIKKGEEVILPYRYVLINNQPFISDKIINYLKKHPL